LGETVEYGIFRADGRLCDTHASYTEARKRLHNYGLNAYIMARTVVTYRWRVPAPGLHP
jgi:hypothetical protein